MTAAPTQWADYGGFYSPAYGFRAVKSHNLATDNVDLFTVTGKVAITLLTGEVTTVIGGAATYAMRVKTTTEAIFAATTIDSDVQGTMYLFGGDPTVTLNNAGTPTTRVENTWTGSALDFAGSPRAFAAFLGRVPRRRATRWTSPGATQSCGICSMRPRNGEPRNPRRPAMPSRNPRRMSCSDRYGVRLDRPP